MSERQLYPLGEQSDGSFVIYLSADNVQRMRALHDEAWFKTNGAKTPVMFGRGLAALREFTSLCGTVIVNALGPWQ